MNLILFFLSIIIGGLAGIILDVKCEIDLPPLYWFIGGITGASAIVSLHLM